MVRKTDVKRTKIVCTIGPASSDPEVLRRMIRAGMDVARINFSHGSHETHARNIETIRRVAAEEDAVIAILGDLQGPKIRLGKIAHEPVTIKEGDRLTLTYGEATGANMIFNLPHPEFMQDVDAGERLLLDDGQLEFKVLERQGEDLLCEVVVGGHLSSNKGVSAPDSRLTLSAIPEKDQSDVIFAMDQNLDYIAMSFVRYPKDIQELRDYCHQTRGREIAIVAKIERREAIENIDAIIDATDAVMVARGDLGVETPAQDVPVHQKNIIRKCNALGKPVITATQMLQTMISNPRPTRAEVSDVANAIFDGTDAIMLSGESASGKFPVQAVETMCSIALSAEAHLAVNLRNADQMIHVGDDSFSQRISDATSIAAAQIASQVRARWIVTTSSSGYTARQVARMRSNTPILCMTPYDETVRKMALVWGVLPLKVGIFRNIDDMITQVVTTAYDAQLIDQEDVLVITAALPFGRGSGNTNFMKVHRVGEMGEVQPRETIKAHAK